MPNRKSHPIAGVVADSENEIMTVFPSIASTGLGRALGVLYESIPLKINGVKLSYLLFPLPTSPVALVWYFLLKLTGWRCVLTNRTVQKWSGLGNRLLAQVPLSDIAKIVVAQRPGQSFYRAADLELYGTDGKRLMTLAAIPHAEIFRESILEARDALVRVENSLATIRARQTA